jgi:hypothetical protein
MINNDDDSHLFNLMDIGQLVNIGLGFNVLLFQQAFDH